MNHCRLLSYGSICLLFTAGLSALGVSGSGAAPSSGGLHYTSPAEETGPFANPGRGWYWPVMSTPREVASFSTLAGQSISVVMIEADLGAFKTSLLSAAKLTEIANAFDEARRYGLSVIFRAAYDFDGVSGREPTSLNLIVNHIYQLSPIFQRNHDILVAIQAGFLGLWGEWHASYFTKTINGRDDIPTDVKAAVVNALLAAAPADVPIELRRPRFVRELVGDAPPTLDQAFSGLPLARIGYHNDCFIASASDTGTYDDKAYSRAAELAWAQRQLVALPFTAETCSNSSYAQRADVLGELTTVHAQQLNITYKKELINYWRSTAVSPGVSLYDVITQRLGYRFVADRIGLSATASPGGGLAVHLDLRNTGFGNLLQPHNAVLVLTAPSQPRLTVPLADDPRNWRREDGSISLDWTVALPGNLAAGTWDVGLALPSAEPALAGRAAYAIRLANQGLWQADGVNRLGSVVVGSPNPTPTPTSTPTPTVTPGPSPTPTIPTTTPTPTPTPTPTTHPNPVPAYNGLTLTAVSDGTNLIVNIVGKNLNRKSQLFITTPANPSYTYSWPQSGITHLVENTTLYTYNGSGKNWSWKSLATAKVTKTATSITILLPLSQIRVQAGSSIGLGFMSGDDKNGAYPLINQPFLAYLL